MNLKKFSLILCATLILATLCSCKENQKAKTAEGDIPEITMLYNRGSGINIDENDEIYKTIEEKTGVKLKLIVPPIQEYDQKLNIIMASGDLPDIIRCGIANMRSFAEQGAFLAIDHLLSDYAPNSLKFLDKNIWSYVKVDEKIYGIPTVKTPQKYNMYIRSDWLSTLKLEIPETLDEFKMVLKAFVEEDPDRNGVDDTYGFIESQFSVTGTTFAPFFAAFGVKPNAWYLEDDKIMPYVIHPNMKEALAFIKTLNQEGLVNPDWLSISGERAKQIMDSNKGGSAYGWWNYPTTRLPYLKQIEPNADLIPIKPPVGLDGISRNISGPIVGAVCYSITKDCKNPEAAIKFLDFFYNIEGWMITPMGLEGEHWNWISGGEMPKTVEELNARIDDLVVTEKFSSDFDRRTALSLFEPQVTFLELAGRDQKSIDCINFSRTVDVIRDYADGLTSDATIKYNTALNQLTEETFVKIIIGEYPIEHFDSFCEEWLNSGGNEVIKGLNAAYRKINQ